MESALNTKNILKKDLLLFDLDGTLVDSSKDIAVAANSTLCDLGKAELTIPEIQKSVGWGIKTLLRGLMPNETDEVISEGRTIFLDYYSKNLYDNTHCYDGVVETLDYFAGQGKLMAVITNKPEDLSVELLDALNLSKYFKLCYGGDTFSNRKPHPEPILKAIKALGVTADKAVMIGDSPVDYEAGTSAGVQVIGCSYGFRGGEELADAGVSIFADSFSSLRELLR